MKNLSLLVVMLMVSLASLADNRTSAPSRIAPDQVFGDQHYIYQRSNHGSAVDPVTHTFMVPQSGILEAVTWDGDYMYYIKNIVYGSETEFGEYWVEGYGDQEGGFYVPLGQTIYVQTRDGRFVPSERKAVLVWGTIHYDAVTHHTSFTPSTEMTGVNYSVDGNTIHIENTSGPVAIEAQDDVSYDATGLGIVWEEEGEEGEWAGYFEWGTSADTTPFLINWQPEGEMKTYTRTSDCIHYSYNDAGAKNWSTPDVYSAEKLSDESQIVFGTDGKTVYLKNPLLSMGYDTWIMGTLSDDGSKITVNGPQYLWVYDNYRVTIAKGTSLIKEAHPYGEAPYDYLEVTNNEGFHQIVYSIDGDKIMLTDTKGNATATYPDNYDASGLCAYDSKTNKGALEANIVYVLKSVTPPEPTEKTSAPVINGYSDPDGSIYYIEIQPTEPSAIHYRVLCDGESTDWEEYSLGDVLSYSGEGSYTIEAYAQATDKLASDVVDYRFSISPQTSVIESMTGKEVVGRRYYNVMGQSIDQPDGLTIMVTSYSDGTTTAEKIVK